jgi:hypothetical protein
VPFTVLPEFVRLVDVNVPSSLQTVRPDDLSTSFGAGVVLKRVIIQITNDRITVPPESWPRWLLERKYKAMFGESVE